MSIQRLWGWFARFYRWLAEAKLVIMCLLIITAAVMLGFKAWPSESSIRSSGYALQLIGMVFAIGGLLGIRKHFKQPSLKILVVSWLRRFPKWKIKKILGEGGVTLKSCTADGEGELWKQDDPSKSVQKRIDNIIENLETIRNKQRDHSKSIDDLKSSHEELKQDITAQTKNIEDGIRADIELLHTSDITTSLAGLILLLVGISMSTLAPELYTWLY